MPRARFVVRDLSTYVAPVGGRCPKWGVLDLKLSTARRPFYRDTCETRGEARKRAASRNKFDKDLATLCTDDPAMFDVTAPSCESF